MSTPIKAIEAMQAIQKEVAETLLEGVKTAITRALTNELHIRSDRLSPTDWDKLFSECITVKYGSSTVSIRKYLTIMLDEKTEEAIRRALIEISYNPDSVM